MDKFTRQLLCFLFLSSFLATTNHAQEIVPKREFRGAWVATVANIDFPSKPGIGEDRFKEEWASTMAFFKDAGLNAVFAQVRPAGDAFYRSKIAPWSKYLTGKNGKAPRSNYDPMAFMINEAHKQNIEFHAWLNPYRASMDTLADNLSDKHPYHSHPEWFVQYGGKLYFNPALPEVRNYLTEIVMEIVMDYDVDGIHFDDYFYPYPAAGELYPDQEDFAKYGYGYLSIDDWRRSNVNALISQISEMLKTVAPQVKFGVSPFGVWRNASLDPKNGSKSQASIGAYDDLYADVRFWLEKGWIDYVAPQLYWHIGFSVADYELLLDWWQKNAFGRNVYAGHAAYKVGVHTDPAWRKRDQIPRQIALNRIFPNVEGSIFYNTSALKKNLLGMTDSLRYHYFKNPALWPEMKYMNLPLAPAPKLAKAKYKKGKIKIKCSLPAGAENAHYLVVYRFEDRLPGDYENPANIFRIIPLDGRKSLVIEDDSTQKGKSYTYAVTAVNRQHSESNLSEWRAMKIGSKRAKRLK
ncbi:MAG TPA: glycoside hydrolase family 10 protein [Bacteroidetes bacterium]|nr:glycoside hydrolase family 10 protein [Bacteroidota bacterium]